MLVPLSASHAHSLANLRRTPDEVVQEIARIRAARDAAGSSCLVEVGLSTAFGCTIQGRVETVGSAAAVKAVLDAGVDRVGLADTVGYADPAMVQRLVQARARGRRRSADLRALPRHARPRHGERVRRMAIGHHAVRRLPRRHRRVPARAGCERQRHDRGRRVHVREHGSADRPGFRRAASRCARRSRNGSKARSCTARCGARTCRRRCAAHRPGI